MYVNLDGLDLSGLNISRVKFDSASLKETNFSHTHIGECRFQNIDLSNTPTIINAVFNRDTILNDQQTLNSIPPTRKEEFIEKTRFYVNLLYRKDKVKQSDQAIKAALSYKDWTVKKFSDFWTIDKEQQTIGLDDSIQLTRLEHLKASTKRKRSDKKEKYEQKAQKSEKSLNDIEDIAVRQIEASILDKITKQKTWYQDLLEQFYGQRDDIDHVLKDKIIEELKKSDFLIEIENNIPYKWLC